jgi:hypothetical protein
MHAPNWCMGMVHVCITRMYPMRGRGVRMVHAIFSLISVWMVCNIVGNVGKKGRNKKEGGEDKILDC